MSCNIGKSRGKNLDMTQKRKVNFFRFSLSCFGLFLLISYLQIAVLARDSVSTFTAKRVPWTKSLEKNEVRSEKGETIYLAKDNYIKKNAVGGTRSKCGAQEMRKRC
jgi:hypothetical protein